MTDKSRVCYEWRSHGAGRRRMWVSRISLEWVRKGQDIFVCIFKGRSGSFIKIIN